MSKGEHISFETPDEWSNKWDAPEWIKKEIKDFASSDASPHDSNSSVPFDGQTVSQTSVSDATDSSSITPSSDASPHDSNSSVPFDDQTVSQTSVSDATDSSSITPSSDASPHDSNPNSSTSNEQEETFLFFGRKMTRKQFENLSINQKQRELFQKNAEIYRALTESPSAIWSFAGKEMRKLCRKVTIEETDDESIQVYEPIVAYLRSQNLFENELVVEHYKCHVYVNFVNMIFEILGLIPIPPLLLGNTDLSVADYVGILRLTYPITKVQHWLKIHTFVEWDKWARSIASTTDAKIAYVVLDSDSLGKNGGYSSLFTQKSLQDDPGLKELLLLYYGMVEKIQKYALPISIKIIKDMIQKNKVGENKEEQETEILGEKTAELFMISAQSSNYLQYFPGCCEQVTALCMRSFKNGNADMEKLNIYHLSTQNRRDGNGLLTLGSFHRAFYFLVSSLAIIHKQPFDVIFGNKMFDFIKLLEVAGVTRVKDKKLALSSKDTIIFFRLVGSNTIESCSFENFVRKKGFSYEEVYSLFASAHTYKDDVQELRDYDVSLNKTSLEKCNTFRGVSECNTDRFRATISIQGKTKYLGTYPSQVIAAYVRDKAVILSGIRGVTLNFDSQEYDVALVNEIITMQESMSEEESAQFDPGSFISECEESIPSDDVIKGVVKGNLSWSQSLANYSESTDGNTDERIKFRGVSETDSGKFISKISIQGKSTFLGTYLSPMIAAYVRDKAVILSGRRKYKINFEESEEVYEEIK